MDTYHPDMLALERQLQQKRQERELRQAQEASRALQAQTKRQNHQHDLLQAARMAGA